MGKIFVQYCMGYLIAVLGAVFVTELFMFALTILPDGGQFGSFFKTFESALTLFWMGTLYTFATALPGFTATIILAGKLNRHSASYYCICGILTALLAHFLLAIFLGGKFFQGIWIIVSSIQGGAAGAYIYYRWRLKILPT